MNIVEAEHVRKGTHIKFPNHAPLYEVVEAATEGAEHVGILCLGRGVFYEIPRNTVVDVIHS